MFNEHLKLLPPSLITEVIRYKSFKDRVQRLVGRLLVRKAIIETGYKPDLLFSWNRTQYNKPFIYKWHPFNISHSKEIVAIVFGGHSELGIDIEHVPTCNDPVSLEDLFHPEEIQFIKIANNEEFINYWVKKEAFLKAIGIGLINGLKEFSCCSNIVTYCDQIWYLHKLPAPEDYVSYLSTNVSDCECVIRTSIITDHLLT